MWYNSSSNHARGGGGALTFPPLRHKELTLSRRGRDAKTIWDPRSSPILIHHRGGYRISERGGSG